MKLLTITALILFASLAGCSIYSHGHVASAFDSKSINIELRRAEKEYGNK